MLKLSLPAKLVTISTALSVLFAQLSNLLDMNPDTLFSWQMFCASLAALSAAFTGNQSESN